MGTSVARSGPPSPPEKLLLAPAGTDPAAGAERACADPPTGSLQVGGPQVRVGDRLFTSAAATVEVTAMGADGAPARWLPVIGGQDATAWPAAWPAGAHTAGALVIDGCGHRVPLTPVAFVTDTEPPLIRWQVGDQKSLSDRLAPDSESSRRRLRGRRGGGHPATDAWQTLAGVWQLPVPWVKEKRGVYAQFPVEIKSDHPQAFLAAPDTTLSADGKNDRLDDAGAGVERLILRSRTETDRVVLEVEAVDLVGNSSKKEIVLRRLR
jgi:hypothetical protein